MKDDLGKLKKLLPGLRKNVLLKDFTTFRIGGPADFFYEAKNEKQLLKAVIVCRKFKILFFILGRGSNVLFSDEGFRGLVIRNMVSGIKVVKKLKRPVKNQRTGDSHYLPADPKKYLQFSDLDYQQEPFDAELEVFSGTSLQYLIRWALENKLTGLQWFAGIPGSVGGAVVYNVHGGTKLFGDYVKDITCLDKNNRLRKIKKANAEFAYDKSRFQKEGLVVIKATILLSKGDIARARYVFDEWRQRKLKVQPQINCPGSVFQNFSKTLAKKAGAPTTGAGWFIDQAGLKGKRVGNVKVSQIHANFIVNLGKGKAKDVRKLIKLIKEKVRKKFGLALREEILILSPKI